MGKLAALKIESFGVLSEVPAAKAGWECDIFFALAAVPRIIEYETSMWAELLE